MKGLMAKPLLAGAMLTTLTSGVVMQATALHDTLSNRLPWATPHSGTGTSTLPGMNTQRMWTGP